MSEIQYVGLIVTSIMSVMLFWKMICVEEIEKSFQSFFLTVGHALFQQPEEEVRQGAWQDVAAS